MGRDVDVARDPMRRKLIHQASRRVTGTAAADQEFISRLSIELGSTTGQYHFDELPRQPRGDKKAAGRIASHL